MKGCKSALEIIEMVESFDKCSHTCIHVLLYCILLSELRKMRDFRSYHVYTRVHMLMTALFSVLRRYVCTKY